MMEMSTSVCSRRAPQYELEADGDASFVLNPAIKHPTRAGLLLGPYEKATLAQDEAEINHVGQRLRAAGRL